MDSSNYFGEANIGYERGNGSSSSYSSSRKGKKSSNSDKPKQPQRGLGVAQLEKIRLHTQLPPPYQHHPPTPYNYNQPSYFNYNVNLSSYFIFAKSYKLLIFYLLFLNSEIQLISIVLSIK